jgi:hypothetical protein
MSRTPPILDYHREPEVLLHTVIFRFNRNRLFLSLTTPSERSFNLVVFLIQSFATLFRQRILESVRRVVSRHNIDARVQRTKARFASHLGESTIIRHKVDHFLFHILAKLFHLIRALGETCRNDHVLLNTTRIIVVIVRQAPVFGKFVVCRLGRHFYIGHGNARSQEHCRGSAGSGSIEEIATSGFCWFCNG